MDRRDIAAQRAMLERGEEKRKADWQRAERERLRDTFAAAALTGLLSNVQRYQNGPLTEQAFEIADFMLKERDRTSVGVAEMDSATDRKSAATPRACASSCSQPFDSAPTTPALTDEEREAIEQAAIRVESLCQLGSQQRAATLRSLLERTK